MAIQHAVISDPDIHEPKGVAAATAGLVYTSDGAGSGSWTTPELVTTGLRKGLVNTADGAGGSSYEEKVWKDLVGEIGLRGAVGDPAFTAFRANVFGYSFTAGEIAYVAFHIPHDYSPGTDLFLHVHWGHNATAVTGDMVWTYHASYSKGHNQANFPNPVTGTISYATTDIATTPQYRHRVDEIQLSAASPTAAQIDTDDIEVDGVILIQLAATTVPSTLTGASPASSVYLFYIDVHYEATGIGTLNKAPGFYTA